MTRCKMNSVLRMAHRGARAATAALLAVGCTGASLPSAVVTSAALTGAAITGAAGIAAPAAAQTALADLPGDAAKGAKVFRKCKACHAVGAGAKNKTGPQLNGILNREAGSVAGYKYSKALIAAAAAGLTWTPEELDAFLTKPKAHLKGTKMSFAGIRKESQRQDIIKFLSRQGETGG